MIDHIFFQLSQNSLNALAMVFLHSLWQFTLIAALAYVVLKKNIFRTAQARYLYAITCMVTMIMVSFGTFYYYNQPQPEMTLNQISVVQTPLVGAPALLQEGKGISLLYFEGFQDWVVFFWIIGVIFLSVKLLGSLFYIHWIKKSAQYPGTENAIVNQWNQLRKKWNIHKNIKLGFSNNILSPVIIGQIKPVILFPFSLMNQLSPSEVEFILLHEVAHYSRYDWWVNLVQSFVEIIFYYHPAVYYLSQLIREERETCCDEYAIQTVGGQNIAYAKTLIKLQEWESGKTPELAMAFINKNQFFMDRIKKILKMNQRKNVRSENMLIGLIIVASLFFATRETIAANLDFQKSKDYLSDFFTLIKYDNDQIHLDSIPKISESITIIKKDNDKEVKMQMENGEIKQLEIDGQTIQPEEYHKYEDVTNDIKIRSFKMDDAQDPGMFYFGMGDKEFGWNGNFNIQLDSMLSGIMQQNSETSKMWSENMKKEMELLKEKMKDQKLDFNLDSMMAFPGFDGIQNPHFFHFDFPGMQGEHSFEFVHPDDDKIVKRYRFHEGEDIAHEENLTKKHPFFEEDGYGRRNINEVLGNQLNKDGFLIPNTENKVELTGKYLKINGEKQASNIWNKYKSIFEDETGTTLEKNSKISFHFWGKEAKRKYKAF